MTTRSFDDKDLTDLSAATARALNPRAWPHMTEVERAKETDAMLRVLTAAWQELLVARFTITKAMT